MLVSLTSLIKSINYFLFESIFIFFISFLSNTFSAISGGGAGLIQLPLLILTGIPYYQALAMHKFATVALGVGGSLRNYRSLRNDIEIIYLILFCGLPGVALGACIVEFVSEDYLYIVLGVFSILLASYSFHKPDFGLVSADVKLNIFLKVRFVVLIFFIGVLNGSISSGTGLLVTILLIKTFGIDFLRAVSLTFFTVGIFWNALGAIFLTRIGFFSIKFLILLILGSFTGGFFGAHLSNLKGNKLVKNTFTLVCFSVGISLLIKSLKIFI